MYNLNHAFMLGQNLDQDLNYSLLQKNYIHHYINNHHRGHLVERIILNRNLKHKRKSQSLMHKGSNKVIILFYHNQIYINQSIAVSVTYWIG